MKSFVFVLMTAAAMGSLGCELIAGVEKRTLGAAGADGGADGSATSTGNLDLAGCTLAASGSGKLRVGNLVTGTQRYDFCLKKDGVASYAGLKPVFAGSGPACAAGLGYKMVSSSFAVAPASYEVKVVRAGATNCDGDAVAALPSAFVNEGEPAAVYVFGDGTGAPSARRFAESQPTHQIASKIRLIHASPNVGNVDLGIADANKLPAKMSPAVFFKNIPYQTTSPPGASQNGEIDANGYAQRQTSGGRLPLLITETGQLEGMQLLGRRLDAGIGLTIFLAGRRGSTEFPLEVFACDEVKGTGALAACADAPAVSFTVDSMNPQLTGAFVIGEKERRPAVIQRLAELESDVVCVTEIYSDADKEALVAAARGRFPHSQYLKADLETAPTDARDSRGNVPPARTRPPCDGERRGILLNGALDCFRDNCAEPKGSEEAIATSLPTACLEQNCVGSVAPLAGTSDLEDDVCWVCLLSHYQSYRSIAKARSACTTNPKAVYAYDGASGVLLLSRHPLTDQETYVLPSTDWRSDIVRARVTLDNQAQVDVYCGQTNAVSPDCTSRPYTGAYGDGEVCDRGWANEQKLHFERVRDWVRLRSGTTHAKAVLVGDFYAGPGVPGKIDSVEVETYQILSDAFALAIPPGEEPKCTLCSDNPLNSQKSTRTRHLFLNAMPITAVRVSDTILKEPVVDLTVGGTPMKVPVAQYYGLRTVLRVEP